MVKETSNDKMKEPKFKTTVPEGESGGTFGDRAGKSLMACGKYVTQVQLEEVTSTCFLPASHTCIIKYWNISLICPIIV